MAVVISRGPETKLGIDLQILNVRGQRVVGMCGKYVWQRSFREARRLNLAGWCAAVRGTVRRLVAGEGGALHGVRIVCDALCPVSCSARDAMRGWRAVLHGMRCAGGAMLLTMVFKTKGIIEPKGSRWVVITF